ncbi:hypothetical protein K432DRAFT_397277 [Lepidopterella palustris CBS 459.81]|uniref:Uncharacterized protein n=1 Tax=Lepidopterella palustris CBS 459.81 TaxID=1314670 RepID=A0A8E2E177_9PEZI|nr:hypothetical protein K432DRAFT_397277 [Lepidopterella palustris CBS 459.81]
MHVIARHLETDFVQGCGHFGPILDPYCNQSKVGFSLYQPYYSLRLTCPQATHTAMTGNIATLSTRSVGLVNCSSRTVHVLLMLFTSILLLLPIDPSWNPSPETWAAENVDKLLANTKGNWGSGTSFVDYIAKYTGQINQRCGVGVIGTCVVPDCNAFENAGGEKWVYFAAVSIVEMNTALNLINQLGIAFENSFNNVTSALEQWSQTLFNGEKDASGKTIIDYFAGGRFTLSYNVTESEIGSYYFQTMVSNVVNDQWKSGNLPTRQFVMCTNGTALCNETSLYAEGGHTCCLYRDNAQNSLDQSGNYNAPLGLDDLANSTFGINASSITAGSLHSYLAQRLNYNATNISSRIEASLQGNPTTQAFAEGVEFQGIWTLPVCDVGNKGFWVANYDLRGFPCCCGTDCAETNKFISEAQLANFGDFYSKCQQ